MMQQNCNYRIQRAGSHHLKGLLFLGVFLFASRFCSSQQITLRDQAEIKYSAQLTLLAYEGFLNLISNYAIPESKVKEAIQNSYSNTNTKHFYSENVLVEDDLGLEKRISAVRQKKDIKEYLRDFNEGYPKSDRETVYIYNLQFSNLKDNQDYLYINVKFTCLFKGINKRSGALYRATDRVAELRVEKTDQQWNTYISSILFFDSAQPIESSEGDVELNASIVDDGTFSLKMYEQESFFEGTGSNFEKGPKFKRCESFEEAMKEGELAEELRDYGRAKYFYVQALQWKPQEKSVKERIIRLEKIIYHTSKLAGLFYAGKYNEAIRGYEDVIKEDPQNPDYFLGRGKCYEKIKEYSKALNDYSRAIELDGNFVDALNSRAKFFFLSGRSQEAIRDYSLLISKPGYAAVFYPERAKVKGFSGDLDGAINDLDAAIQLQPEVAILYYEKGLIQLKQKEQQQAILSFSTAIEKDSQLQDAYYQRGLVFLNLEDLKSASADLEKARLIGLKGSQLSVINGIAMNFFSGGEVAKKEGDHLKALKNFSNVVLISPLYPDAWLKKGDAHFVLQEYEHAALCYTEALKQDSVSLLFYKRALAHHKSGDDFSAKIDFTRFITIGKNVLKKAEDKAGAWYALGYAQLMLEQNTNAIMSFNEAIKLKNNYPEALFSRGAAYFAVKNYEGAILDLENSLEAWGGHDKVRDPSVFLLLGEAYEANGNLDYALGIYSYIIDSIDQTYEPAYRQRAQFFKRIRDHKSALQDITFILTINKATQQDVDLLTDKGLMELYGKNFKDADLSFNQALSIKEDHPWALFGKACALAGQDKLEESLELYKKAFQTRQIEWTAIKDDPVIKYLNRKKAFKELFEASF